MNKIIWILSAAFALTAGITDLRWRRIPNWLTYSAIPLAIALHALADGWRGAVLSLEGAFFGWHKLIEVLIWTLLINGLMAFGMIIWKKRLRQTLRNIGRMFAAFFHLHLPGQDLTIDNPEAAKVPFGVAAAIAVLLYTALQYPWNGF